MAAIKGYRRYAPGTQPPYLHPPYGSSAKRAPTKPLIYFSHTISEVTGPVFGAEFCDVKASDLTRQHTGEPLGERIIVSGRVIDEDSRPCLWALVEIYQRLLNKIAARNYNVFNEPIRLTVAEKLSVLSRGLLKVVFA